MGMYTEIYVNVNLKENLSDDVVYALKVMIGDEPYNKLDLLKLPNHELFTKPRWDSVLNCCSYYHKPYVVGKFHYDNISEHYYLTCRADLKDYNGEIESFFNFISKYVEDYGSKVFMGYSLYEEDVEPTLYYTTDFK